MTEAQKRWYAKNREKAIAASKQWRKDNPERFKELQKTYREKSVDWSPRREGEIVPQDAVCAICGNPATHTDPNGFVCFKCAKTVYAIRHLDRQRLYLKPFLRFLGREVL